MSILKRGQNRHQRRALPVVRQPPPVVSPPTSLGVEGAQTTSEGTGPQNENVLLLEDLKTRCEALDKEEKEIDEKKEKMEFI